MDHPSKRQATQPRVESTDVADAGAMHARVPTPEGLETTPLQGGRDGVEAEGGRPDLESPNDAASGYDDHNTADERTHGRVGTLGKFCGSEADKWKCAVCRACNLSSQRHCCNCGRVAWWLVDLIGVNGTHVWVPTPDGMKMVLRRGTAVDLESETNDVGGNVGSGRVGTGEELTGNDEWCGADGSMEVVAPSGGVPSSDGGGGSGASSSRLARADRATRRGAPSSTSGGNSKGKKKTTRRTSCSKTTCGTKNGDGELVCYACEQPPKTSEGGRTYWRHFQVHSIDGARRTWSDRMDEGWDRGQVLAGRQPKLGECFCDATKCMYRKVLDWQKGERREGGRACAICKATAESTQKMRHPGSFLHALRCVHSDRDGNNPQKIPLGGTLVETSRLCNVCYMKGVNFVNKCLKGGNKTWSVAEELALRNGCDPAPRNSVEGARSVVRRKLLGRLNDGEIVYLAQAVGMYKKVRCSCGVATVHDKTMTEDMQGVFRELGRTIDDVEYCSYTDGDVGSGDGRKVHHYVMARVLDHRAVAKLHQSLLATEKQLAECIDNATNPANEVDAQQRRSAQGVKEAKMEEAGTIIRKDIELHKEWENCALGRDKDGDS